MSVGAPATEADPRAERRQRSEAGPARGAGLADLAWLLVFAGITTALQAVQRVPFDMDSAFHVAVAGLIRRHGILHDFPWTAFSYLADHYADKELLFHLVLAPFVGLGPWAACRIVGAVLGALVLFVVYRILRAGRVPLAGVWALAALGSSGSFVLRLAMVRPHLLSIALGLVITFAAARRRVLPLAIACFLYPLSYIAWHTALALVVVVSAAELLAGRRPSPRVFAAAAGGLLAGVLVHPNFPENLRLFWVQNVEILVGKAWGGAAGFDLGPEFQPFSPAGVLRQMTFPLLLGAVATARSWRARRDDPLPLAFSLVALAFLAATLRTQRFIEYAAPFSAAAAALALRTSWPRVTAPAIAVAAALWTGLYAGRASFFRLGAGYELYPPEVARRLQRIIPPGEQVFTCDWASTGLAMLALPERRLLVALDPVFFFRKDPALYRTWYELVHAPPERPGPVIARRFGARFVLCEKRPDSDPLLLALDRSGTGRVILQTDRIAAFYVGPWPPQPTQGP